LLVGGVTLSLCDPRDRSLAVYLPETETCSLAPGSKFPETQLPPLKNRTVAPFTEVLEGEVVVEKDEKEVDRDCAQAL